jgi:uncharacterized repeat protein (TIGR03803 family)
MKRRRPAFASILVSGALVAALISASATTAAAETEWLLYGFTGGADGLYPHGVIFDAGGNLYGANENTVFELSRSSSGGWTLTTLYTFSDFVSGSLPTGSLTFDAAGNLYGSTSQGGSPDCAPPNGCGVVFKLSPGTGGWVETVLHTFNGGSDGSFPNGNLVFDSAGNLYGTTFVGGDPFCTELGIGCGTIFKLSPDSGRWEKTTLYLFTGHEDGGVPPSGVIFDAAGNLYGTTTFGGSYSGNCSPYGCGVVFQLSPTSSRFWKETIVHTFTGKSDGLNPEAGLTIDAAGNLYGSAGYGGTHSSGTILKFTPASPGSWKAKILYSFNFFDGWLPNTLTLDGAGNIYGTTVWGGSKGETGICDPLGCGIAFKLSPRTEGPWTETLLHFFTGGHDGSLPSPVVLDPADNVYGTTELGSYNWGAVFELTP